MDATQILLFAVVITLTLLLLIVGVQVFFILKEAKKAIRKTNELLKEASDVLPSVKKPFLSAANLLDTFKNVKQVVEMVTHNKNLITRKNIRHFVQDAIPDTEVVISTRKKRTSARPRYFKRPPRSLSS